MRKLIGATALAFTLVTSCAGEEVPEIAPDTPSDETAADMDDVYERCVVAAGFEPGGVQVPRDSDGTPWWVKTGRDVPGDVHGPCFDAIGGEQDGRSSWGS